MTAIISHDPKPWRKEPLHVPGGRVIDFMDRRHETFLRLDNTHSLTRWREILKSITAKVNATEFLGVAPGYLLCAWVAELSGDNLSGDPLNVAFMERSGIDWNTDIGRPREGKAAKVPVERYGAVDFKDVLGIEN